MNKFILFLPEIYLFVIIFLVFLFSIITSLSSINRFPNVSNSIIYLIIVGFLYTILLFFNNVVYNFDISLLYKTHSNIIFSVLFLLLSIVILLLGVSYNKINNISSLEYLIFILISLGSLIIFLNLVNVIFIYILLELQNILISILISIKKSNRYCIEASIKYFLLGSFSSLIFLYGFSLLYGSTGFISINEINLFFNCIELINNTIVVSTIKISIVFILIGMLFKIYSAPFHFRVSDIYEGSPTSVLIFISSIQSLFMMLLFVKFHYYIFIDFTELKNTILSIVSVLTLFFGSIGALSQRKLKKLIGYSAITVNGFFLFSLINNNIVLLEASMTYSIIYVITILLLFAIILNIFLNNGTSIIKLSDLYNIYKYNKLITLLLVFLLFSVSGLPPFLGFFGKLFWLKSIAIEYNVYIFFLILIFLIVNFYYIRLIKNLYTIGNKNNNVLYYIEKNDYISCICIIFLQLFLLYSIVESSVVRNIVHIYLLNLLNVL